MREGGETKDRRDGQQYKEAPPAEIQSWVTGASMLGRN